jgi:hypothetical protein
MQFSLDSSTALFLYWIVLFMPFMAWASYRKIKSGATLSPKVERFRMAVALLIVTGLIGVATARANLIPLSFSADLVSLVLGAAVLTGLLSGVIRGRHRVPAAHRERIRLLYAPATPAELAWSIVGGIAVLWTATNIFRSRRQGTARRSAPVRGRNAELHKNGKFGKCGLSELSEMECDLDDIFAVNQTPVMGDAARKKNAGVREAVSANILRSRKD